MRVVQELKGLHCVKMPLSDGSVKAYYYAWRGGPRIKAKFGTPAFFKEYNELVTGRGSPDKSTLGGMITAFKGAPEYTKLSVSSRKAYNAYLALINSEFGTMPLKAVEDPEARGIFKDWRDGLAATPRKADYAWTTLARVLSFAKDRGRISVNVCEKGGRIHKVDRTELIWTNDHINRFRDYASGELWCALVVAIWTGQRQGDLLRMTWSAYDGDRINLRQKKTEAYVSIPVSSVLRDLLDGMDRRAVTILTNQRGISWTSDGFRTSWGKACQKSGIEDVTFHDLRGTAVTRLALSGCTIPEISALTGHSPKSAQQILSAHYLGGTADLAEVAMRKLEKNEQGAESVKWSDKPVKRSSHSSPE